MSTRQETIKGVIKYTEKNTSSIRNHVLHGHANKFTSFLSLLELRKTSQPDDAYEISTDDGNRQRRKANEVSAGGRISYYLLSCHPYGDNHPKQSEFDGNVISLMSHVFIFLLLVDHECFRKLTHDINQRLHPGGSSKLLQSIIPTENQSLQRYVIDNLEKGKDVVISYNLWISRKMEKHFPLVEHYCTGPQRNNTHVGMPSTTDTYGVSLYFYIMVVVENFRLEANIVRIISDGGGNLRVFMQALDSKYTNESVFPSHKTLFTMDFLSHIFIGGCKVGVQSIRFNYG